VNEEGANFNTSLQLTWDTRARFISGCPLIYLWMGLWYAALSDIRDDMPTNLAVYGVPMICRLEARM